jgi:Domain of unknown function (DUF4383)/Putative zinc-finger
MNTPAERGDTGEHHTLVGAYVLDALDDIERAAFDRHLRTCASCSLEVMELRDTVARMAADTVAAPPPALRDNVLATIARTRQESAGAARTRTSEPTVSRWRRYTAVAVAAGVIAVGGGATVWSISRDQVRKAQTEATAERNNTLVAFAAGAAFVLVGLLGFTVSGGHSAVGHDGGLLLGVFQVDLLHNVVRLLVGAVMISAAIAGTVPAKRFNTIVGAVYLLLFLIGLVIIGNSAANLIALNPADNVLHLVLGVVLLGIGVLFDRKR